MTATTDCPRCGGTVTLTPAGSTFAAAVVTCYDCGARYRLDLVAVDHLGREARGDEVTVSWRQAPSRTGGGADAA